MDCNGCHLYSIVLGYTVIGVSIGTDPTHWPVYELWLVGEFESQILIMGCFYISVGWLLSYSPEVIFCFFTFRLAPLTPLPPVFTSEGNCLGLLVAP